MYKHSPFDFQIRLRCQKGIPPSLRGRAWQYLSGGKVKLQQNPGKFDVSGPSFTLPSLPCLLMPYPWQQSSMYSLGPQQYELINRTTHKMPHWPGLFNL